MPCNLVWLLAMIMLQRQSDAVVDAFVPTHRHGAVTKSARVASVSFAAIINGDQDRNMESLKDWAISKGIEFAKDVSLSKQGDGDWGVVLHKPKNAGDIVLRVPRDLAFSSNRINAEIGNNKISLKDADRILAKADMLQYKPEFLLFLKILTEKSLGSSSLWHTWLESLPTSFDTGICMDELELSCLPPLGMALATYEQQRLDVFRSAVRATALKHDFDQFATLLERDEFDRISKWAFNVVFTRCWRFSAEGGQDDDADIVPLGDMFNHREPANVMVQDYPDSDMIYFVLLNDVNGEENLYLSYGLNNPYRFLVIFGFVDESMPEIFSQVIFTDPGPELIELGCNDRSKMVYRTEDGAISNAVWDTILYALLESRPQEQEALYRAHVEGDKEAKTKIHATYALEAAYYLRQHVEETLGHLNANEASNKYCDSLDDDTKRSHPRLALVCKNTQFLKEVNEKVKKRLDDMVETETRRRLLQRSSNEK